MGSSHLLGGTPEGFTTEEQRHRDFFWVCEFSGNHKEGEVPDNSASPPCLRAPPLRTPGGEEPEERLDIEKVEESIAVHVR